VSDGAIGVKFTTPATYAHEQSTELTSLRQALGNHIAEAGIRSREYVTRNVVIPTVN